VRCPLSSSHSFQPPQPSTAELSAHLWDLRSQAEAKLRCLTRLQQAVDAYDSCAVLEERVAQRAHILKDLQDIVAISHALRSVSDLALKSAGSLS
jgi:hypothetical protein